MQINTCNNMGVGDLLQEVVVLLFDELYGLVDLGFDN